MTHDQLTYDDLLRIVELIKTSEQFSEFRLKIGEIEVELRRRSPGGAPASAPATPAATAASHAPAPATGMAGAGAPGAGSATTAPTEPPAPRPARQEESWPEGSIVIRSPMVGTFYRAPEPGAPAFVEVGRAVEPDTTVCIIEVMKLMNSIPAGARGRVTHILVDDAQPVATGEALIVVEPAR